MRQKFISTLVYPSIQSTIIYYITIYNRTNDEGLAMPRPRGEYDLQSNEIGSITACCTLICSRVKGREALLCHTRRTIVIYNWVRTEDMRFSRM